MSSAEAVASGSTDLSDLPKPDMSLQPPASSTPLADQSVSPSGVDKGKERASEADDLPEEEKHIGRPTDGLDEDETILLTTIPKAKLVGITNYAGIRTLRKGIRLDMRRDHVNIYDKNAIEVRHANKGAKVGFISKGLASLLAPLIDQELIEVDGTILETPPPVGAKEVPFGVRIYGTRAVGRDPRLDFAFATRAKRVAEAARAKKEAEELARHERQLKLELDEHNARIERSQSRGLEPTKELDKLMLDSILVEQGDRATGDLLSSLFQEGAMDPTALPEHPCPPGRKDRSMRTDLLPFQKQGLAWMIRMEHPRLPASEQGAPVQLWRKKLDAKGDPFWHNIATDATQREKPVLKRGGVLADEMGLGKTMQTIALICTDDTGDGVLDEPEEPDDRYDDMTLIVCPLSVASNWTVQLQQHVGSKRIQWHLYHGEGRELSRKELRQFDIVITTYQTLAGELYPTEVRPTDEPDSKKSKPNKPKEGTLQSIKWRRVVLDEGHVIKNPKAKMSLACAALKAERRWVLTGTPIINSTKDLGAMLTFLKLCKPLDEPAQWNRYVEAVARENPQEGGKLLRAVVSSTTLQRKKNMTNKDGRKLVTLPEIKFYLHKVKLLPDVRKVYDEVANELRQIVMPMLKSGQGTIAYSSVLTFLLRLRQIANDPALCPYSFYEQVHNSQLSLEVAQNLARGPSKQGGDAAELQSVLRKMIDAGENCSLCFDPPAEPVVTPDGNLFCSACIRDYIDNFGVCPVTRRPLSQADLVGLPAGADPGEDEAEVLQAQAKNGVALSTHAAKTRQLIKFLEATEPDVKSLVFSQWTSHLNCIEAALDEAGISCCRFDGSMTQQKREAIIASFSAPPPKPAKKAAKPKKGEKAPPKVMLISLKAGALGLNLTCASQVFLMDPWWQASIESQAIDRVYRIGQTKPVKVFQLIAEDTVEDKVLEIQKRKDALVSSAFSGNKAVTKDKERIESRLADLSEIFGLDLP